MRLFIHSLCAQQGGGTMMTASPNLSLFSLAAWRWLRCSWLIKTIRLTRELPVLSEALEKLEYWTYRWTFLPQGEAEIWYLIFFLSSCSVLASVGKEELWFLPVKQPSPFSPVLIDYYRLLRSPWPARLKPVIGELSWKSWNARHMNQLFPSPEKIHEWRHLFMIIWYNARSRVSSEKESQNSLLALMILVFVHLGCKSFSVSLFLTEEPWPSIVAISVNSLGLGASWASYSAFSLT